jgi:uncharacterized protein
VEKAEGFLNELGFYNVRVRHYGSIARIEVPAEKIPELKFNYKSLSRKLNTIGFQECIIDEEGLVSGKLNRLIS